VEIAEHIAAVREQGKLLAAAAERAPLDSPVPSCPDWRLRDLVRHIGGVHRWATEHVSKPGTDNFDPFDELARNWPPDEQLVEWFREGHAGLVRALERADPNAERFTFLPAPSSLAFWARRQAHETGIHRADAELASGNITPYEPRLASDGIEELIFGFVGSRPRSKLTAENPRTLHLHATDCDGEWLVRIGPSDPQLSREHADADCTVQGAASELYLFLWNRVGQDGLQISGDPRVLDQWRTTVRVRWS
jgi:uncharacterized protein (TIGR03083 family)